MSGDYSRLPFDPSRDHAGVLLQQGRPLTDWDWNAQALLALRRQQATTYDTFGPNPGGRAVVPLTTPLAFALTISGNQLALGRGRAYVDGLLVENHGLVADNPGPQWDPILAEQYGTQAIPYLTQPWLPEPPPLPQNGGPYLVYLDVWQREITQFIDPTLVDVALGVDTTTRLQTIWQVKVFPQALGNQTCDTPLASIPGWNAANGASAGRLTTSVVDPVGEDPCLIPPGGGYKGLENQLYRVEIHTGGAPGTATFKWSRDNASVEARVLNIIDATTLVLDSLGKDTVLGFAAGQWIELTDEWRDLSNLPGELVRIADNGVDDATRRVTLATPLLASWAPGVPDPARRTRIRRWDQQDTVLRSDGSDWIADLNTTGGAITVPPAGTVLMLENGVCVDFSVATAAGTFRAGDWWIFAARAADASLEQLTEAPPRGIHHHYGKLGTIGGGANPTLLSDCRLFWPPAVQPATGKECLCTICVGPGDDLQAAVDSLPQTGGHLCLAAGTYLLPNAIMVRNRKRLLISGAGPATIVDAGESQVAFLFMECDEIELRDLRAISGPGKKGPQAFTSGTICILFCRQVRIINCDLECSDASIATGHCINAVGIPERPSMRLTIDRNRMMSGADQIVLRVDNAAFVRIADNHIGVAGPTLGNDVIRAVPTADTLARPVTATKAKAKAKSNASTRAKANALAKADTLATVDFAKANALTTIDGLSMANALATAGAVLTAIRLTGDLGVVQIQDNVITGAIEGITIAGGAMASAGAPAARNTEVMIARNVLHGFIPDGHKGKCHGISVTSARTLHIIDTIASIGGFRDPKTTDPSVICGIRVDGVLGPFLAVRQSCLTGFTMGVSVRPASQPTKPMWIVAETMAQGALVTVDDPMNVLIKQNNLP